MAFDLMVQLDVTDRRCLVVGGGPQAVARARTLLDAGAAVEVLAVDPSMPLRALADEGRLTLSVGGYRPGDLAGAFLAVVTLEDATDAQALWAEAEDRGVLVSTLDDVAHCHFAAPAMVRRGDLKLAVATAGRAPALAKRLRQQLEAQLGPEYGELVDVLHAARAQALPREVGFGEWARRWERALADVDGLAELIRARRGDEVRRRVLAAITGETTPERRPA